MLGKSFGGGSTCRGMKYGKSFEGNRHVGELHMGGDVASFGGQSTCREVEYGRGFGGEATCGRMKYELWRRIGMSGSHCMDMSASFRKVYRPACTTRISTVNKTYAELDILAFFLSGGGCLFMAETASLDCYTQASEGKVRRSVSIYRH